MAIDLPLTSSARATAYRAGGQWPDVTVAERFLDTAARYPDKAALRIDGVTSTYADLARDVRSLASGLIAVGLSPGDVVAGQFPNGREIPLLHLACNLAGLLFMPLHDSWRTVELEHLLVHAGVKLLVTPVSYRGFDHHAMISQMRGNLPALRDYFTLVGAAPGARDFAELLQHAPREDAEMAAYRPDPDLPAAIMLSGGTTALSKISRFSSNNLLAFLGAAGAAVGFGPEDIAAAIAPAGTGATGYCYGILMPLLNGATSVILPRWGDPSAAVDLIADRGCTYGVAIPTQLTKMVPVLKERGTAAFERFRCFANAGAPLPYATAVQIEELMDCAIQSIYGATDGGTPTVTTIYDPREKRLATVGRPVPACECEIRDEDGRTLPPGQAGEIVWRGPDKSWGYLGDDAQTAAAFTEDEFYKSGDIGRFDADGYLQIVGRIKDMILRGGRNVSPRAIEELLIKHPAVADVAVAPMPDPVLGERACAFVIPSPGETINLAGAVAFLTGQGLAVWQLPEGLVLLDELPRSPGGKTLKSALTAMVSEASAAEPAS